MTSVEAAKKIIAQDGRCTGVSCACDYCPGNDRHPCVTNWDGGGKASQEAMADKLAWFKRWLSKHGEEGGESKEGKPVEVGKWYLATGFEGRGPGKLIGVVANSPSHLLEHPSWAEGHGGNGFGPKGVPGHCWYYDPSVLREVPPPSESEAGRPSPVKTGVVVNIKIRSTEFDLAAVGVKDSLVSKRRRMRASLISRI